MYYEGLGVPKNNVEAMKWLRKAAEQGDDTAQDNLGNVIMLESWGTDVPQDYSEAMKWYLKAAYQRNAHALSSLGAMYEKGQGVPQDYVQAHKWYNLAAAAWNSSIGDYEAEHNRDRLAAQMTPEQIAEAQKLAREWKPN